MQRHCSNMTAPSTPSRPKSPAFKIVSAIWSEREAENVSKSAAGSSALPYCAPLYPFSPKKVRSKSSDDLQQKFKQTTKLYIPVAKMEEFKLTMPSVRTPMSPNRSHSMGTYTVTVPGAGLLRKSKSLPVKKTVSFAETNDIREIEKTSDLSEEVIADLWWSANDYHEIRKEYEFVLFLLDTEKSVREDEHSSRGLLHRTEAGAWALYENQRNARNAVLIQQDLQRRKKVNDPHEIAKAYVREVTKTREKAVQQAAADAAEAKEILTLKRKNNPLLTVNEVSSDRMKFAFSNPRPFRPRPPAMFVDSIAHLDTLKAAHTKSPDIDTLRLSDNEDDGIPLKPLNEHLSRIQSIEDSVEDVAKSSIKAKNDETKYPKRVPEKVRFSKQVKRSKSRKVNDLDKEASKRWYSKRELQKIEVTFGLVIEMMERGIELDGDNDDQIKETRRGLEKSTEDGAFKLYERRRDALNAVLVLQEQQQKDYGIDPVALAEAYSAATKEARKEALKFGKQDAREAKKLRLRRRSDHCQKAPSPQKLFPQEIESKSTLSSDASGDEQAVTVKIKSKNKSTKYDLHRVSCSDLADTNVAFASSTDDTECEDQSARSLLNFDDNDDCKPAEVPMERPTLHRRLSSSHAPSKRFLFTTATVESKPKDVNDQSTCSERCKPEKVTWKRVKNTIRVDLSESAAAYEEAVTEIVVTSTFVEPTENDVQLAVVQHIFSSSTPHIDNDEPLIAVNGGKAEEISILNAIDHASSSVVTADTQNRLGCIPSKSLTEVESPSETHGKSESIQMLDPDQGNTDPVSGSTVSAPALETRDPDASGTRQSPISVVGDNSNYGDGYLAYGDLPVGLNHRDASNESSNVLVDCKSVCLTSEMTSLKSQQEVEWNTCKTNSLFASERSLQCNDISVNAVVAVDALTKKIEILVATEVELSDGSAISFKNQPAIAPDQIESLSKKGESMLDLPESSRTDKLCFFDESLPRTPLCPSDQPAYNCGEANNNQSDKPSSDEEPLVKQVDVESNCGKDSAQYCIKSLNVCDTTQSDSMSTKDDAVVWFKVRSNDFVEIQLDNGRMAYLLTNSEKLTRESAFDQRI